MFFGWDWDRGICKHWVDDKKLSNDFAPSGYHLSNSFIAIISRNFETKSRSIDQLFATISAALFLGHAGSKTDYIIILIIHSVQRMHVVSALQTYLIQELLKNKKSTHTAEYLVNYIITYVFHRTYSTNYSYYCSVLPPSILRISLHYYY